MDDYLIHFGVKGMKWGVRKEEYRNMDSDQRRATRKKYRENKKLQTAHELSYMKNAGGIGKSAAKSYFKFSKTGNEKDKSKMERREATLTSDQVKNGRYLVARGRNIRRKALAGSAALTIGSAGAAAMAVSGAAILAPLAVATIPAGLVTGGVINKVTRGSYYSKQAKLYGKKRAKTQAKFKTKAGKNDF